MNTSPPRPIDGVNLRWLVRGRWVAYLGLLLLVTSVQQLARVHFHQWLALAVVALGSLSNLAVGLPRFAAQARRSTALLLLVDLGLLTLLLFAMGGPTSPLVLGYVLLLVVASALLPRRTLWLMCGLALVALLLTALAHAPISVDHSHPSAEHSHDHEVNTPEQHLWLHVRELWLATLVLVVLVVYVVRWAFDQRDSEVQVLRAELERNARLAELWTLAASAAHELGTPLATISVVARELERRTRGSDGDPRVRDDLAVICQQLERCREVLDTMTNHARTSGREPSVEVTLGEFVDEARGSASEPERVEVRITPAAASSRGCIPRRLLLSVVQNLIDNALEAAPAGTRVQVEASADPQRWSLRITDAGPGLSTADLVRAGQEPFTQKSQGMGVGLFLGKAIVERLGGVLRLTSGAWGTTAELSLPRAPAGRSGLAFAAEAQLTRAQPQ